MNLPKSIGINLAVAGLVIVFAILWKNSEVAKKENELNTAWQDSLRTARITVKHHEDSTKTQRPPETIATRGNRPPSVTFVPDVDTTMQDLCNRTMAENAELKARNEHLELETCTNIVTGRGDSVNTCYNPKADSFAFKLAYSPDWIRRIHDDTLRTVSEPPSHSDCGDWWGEVEGGVALSAHGEGFGGKLGYKSIGIGYERVDGVDFIKAGFKFTLFGQ